VRQTFAVGKRRFPRRLIGLERSYRIHDAVVARHIRRHPGTYDAVHSWSGCVQILDAARRVNLPSFREVCNAHTADSFAAAAHASAVTGVALPKGYAGHHDELHLRREEIEFENADHLLTPSDYVAESFRTKGFPEERLSRHSYGYDPARFYSEGRPAADRPFTAIYVGRVEPLKGLHIGLEAWRHSGLGERGGRFVVLGSQLDAYRHYLADRFSDVSVEYAGFTDDVGAFMRAADVLVFPTYTEGSALVSYEAMACGVVPLVSSAAGAPVRDGIDGLVHEPEDVDTLVRQLNQVSADPHLLRGMSAAAVEASHGLTWAMAGRRLREIYLTDGRAKAGRTTG
jgi:glycosyltransferase involved in cell wall biosynthesis